MTMRTVQTISSAAIALLVWGACSPAAASELQWQGRLDLGVGGLTALSATGSGLASVNDGLALETLALHGGITGHAVVPITDPLVTAGGLVSVRATVALGSGTLRVDPDAASSWPALSQGALALPGRVRLCLLYAGCSSGSLDVPLTRAGTRGAGLGGIAELGFGSVRVSVIGAPWTIRTASTLVPTHNGTISAFAFGFLHGPLSFASSAAFTSQGAGGAIQLVTPVRIEGLSDTPRAGFATLHLDLLPEPGALLGLASAAAGLWLLHRGRHRS